MGCWKRLTGVRSIVCVLVGARRCTTAHAYLLIEHTGAGVAGRFLNDYLDLLPARASRIVAGLAAQDKESTLDALMSLRIASEMAGAREMEEISGALEEHVEAGQ